MVPPAVFFDQDSKVTGWLGDLLTSALEILDSLIAPVLAAIAAIALLWAVRKLRLRWRGRGPRVQITPFAWAAADTNAHDAAWATSLFREQLAALRLDVLDPLPERSPGAPLVEIVEGVGQGVGHGLDIGKAVGRLFRTAWPDASYEVWGTLRPQDGEGNRISVQLVDRGRGNRTLISASLSAASWEQGARQAAMAVAGALYPRVSRKYKGPWTQWRDTVPRELIGDYHRALAYEEDNRLEEAMGAYHSALDRDPLNPHLRLSIAMLQERLALALDAWVTYGAIVDETDRRAWSGADRRVRLIALYRLAILLGNGRIAKQWTKRDSSRQGKPGKRDTERDERRRELRMALERDRLLRGSAIHFSRKVNKAPAAGLLNALLGAKAGTEKARAKVRERFAVSGWEGSGQREISEGLINDVLEILSLQRLEELDAWLRIRPPSRPRQYLGWWRHRPPLRRMLRRRELTRSAVRVSKLLARIRIAGSTERRLLAGGGEDDELDRVREAHRSLTEQWPFPRTGRMWRWLARKLRPRLRWANLRDDAWQLHYNAACAASSVLASDSLLRRSVGVEGVAVNTVLPGETSEDAIVRGAIEELEQYAHRAGSSRVAAQADWVAIDDPDLEGLAEKEEFSLWAGHHLPRGLPDKRANRNIDVNRYTARILYHGARAFADAWRARADDEAASARQLSTWWRQEMDAWERLGRVCWERRSWRQRLKALEALQRWSKATNGKAPIDFGHEDRRRTIKSEKLGKGMFGEIANAVHYGNSSDGASHVPLLRWAHERADHVLRAYESGADRIGQMGLDAAQEREEALRAARIWTRLAEALDAELKGRADLATGGGTLPAPLKSLHDELCAEIRSPATRR